MYDNSCSLFISPIAPKGCPYLPSEVVMELANPFDLSECVIDSSIASHIK